jgi:hypothetical protein
MPSPARSQDTNPITVSVVPGSCLAPCTVRVTVRIAPEESNRSVTITAESLDFYRRSTRQLDGAEAPRLHELRLNEIPAGLYDVRVTVDRANEGSRHHAARFIVGSV